MIRSKLVFDLKVNKLCGKETKKEDKGKTEFAV